MLLPLICTSIILFLHLELGGDEIHLQAFLLPFKWIRAKVFVMCHSLAETRGYTVQNNIDQVTHSHLAIDIKFIDIVQVFLDIISLFEITNPIKSPVQLVMVTIVLPNVVLDLF